MEDLFDSESMSKSPNHFELANISLSSMTGVRGRDGASRVGDNNC